MSIADLPTKDDEQQQRLALVRRFGTFTQAYSTAVQAGLEHFWHDEAYLAYRRKWGVTCVLADPVGPPELHASLLQKFTREFRRICFWQASRGTAEILQSMNFWVNEMGYDTRLELADYDFGGKRKERLRHATNWLGKHHYEVREGAFSHGISVEKIRDLSKAWFTSRPGSKAVYFYNRPPVYVDEVDVRKFFLFSPADEPVAFVFFDPVYRNGQVIGHSPSIKRRLPDAPLRSEEGIMKVAIEQFQREGLERVMLGLSPLAGIEDREFRANPLIHFAWSRGLNAWWVNRYFYNLAGHADFKRRFGGIEEQTYFASDCLFNDFRVVASLRMAGAL